VLMMESPWPEAQKYGSELAAAKWPCTQGSSISSQHAAGVVDRGACVSSWLLAPGGGVVRERRSGLK
jgi:hypothetical protein